MRLILTAIGSYGDVHPMIGLGAAMRDRGHEVTLVTNPHFADEVAAAGLVFEPVSTVDEYNEVTSHADIWHPRRGVMLVMRWAAERLLRPLYERIAKLHQPGETVIAAHPLDLASRVAAESLGVPVVSVVFAPMNLWSDERPPHMLGSPVGPGYPRVWNRAWIWLGEQGVMRRCVRPSLDAVCRGLGLPRIKRVFPDWWFSTGHTLGLFPDWFLGEPGLPGDWPVGTETSGFPLWDASAASDPPSLDRGLEAWLDAQPGSIVFTPGSANRAAASFFDQAIDACGRLRRPALLLTKYPEQLPRYVPAWVRHESFVPLSRVLPRTAAFVHHGGIGSCAQGLAAGVPQLIRPLAFDQLDNASRLERLGVGATIGQKQFTGRTAAQALTHLLDAPGMAARAHEIAKRCDGLAARVRACEYLERVAVERGVQ